MNKHFNMFEDKSMSVCVFPEHVMCTPSRLEWDRSVLAAPSSPPDLVGWAFILLLESSWPLSTPLNAISHSVSLFITLSLFLTPFSLPPRLLLRPCCLEHCAHAKGINMPIRAQGSEQKWLLGEYQSISKARSLFVWDWTHTCWQNARSGCECPHEAAWEMSRACQNKNTHLLAK